MYETFKKKMYSLSSFKTKLAGKHIKHKTCKYSSTKHRKCKNSKYTLISNRSYFGVKEHYGAERRQTQRQSMY
jgi:hypothetical protein